MKWTDAKEVLPYDPNAPNRGYYTKYGDGESDVLTRNQIIDIIENGYLNVQWLDESPSSEVKEQGVEDKLEAFITDTLGLDMLKAKRIINFISNGYKI